MLQEDKKVSVHQEGTYKTVMQVQGPVSFLFKIVVRLIPEHPRVRGPQVTTP